MDMAIESMDGLLQGVPDDQRVAAKAFLDRWSADVKAEAMRTAEGAGAEFRRQRTQLLEAQGKLATYEADLGILRDQAERSKGASEKVTAYEAEIAALKGERDALAKLKGTFSRRLLREHVADLAELENPLLAPALIDDLGLSADLDDDGNIALTADASRRLTEYLEKNRHRFPTRGRPTYQRRGEPAKQATSRADAVRARIAAAKTPEQRAALTRAARAQGLEI